MFDGRELLELDSHTIGSILSLLPAPKHHEKADLLLLSFSKRFPEPAEILTYDSDNDAPLACVDSGRQLIYYVNALRQSGFISGEGSKIQITRPGWDRINELTTSNNASNRAFIACRFTPPDIVNDWQKLFGDAIEKAGFTPVMAHRPRHTNRIDVHIQMMIKQARFIVADVTGANTGVYFEAGYALGLGRKVIWTCKKDSISDMHFDTKQFNHILWSTPEELAEELYATIVATI